MTVFVKCPGRFVMPQVLLSGGLVLTLWLAAGCTSGESPAPGENENAAAAQHDQDRCEKKLEAALQRLAPSAMALASRKEPAVNALNAWLTSCGSHETRDIQISDANAAMLSVTAKRFATAARFTENDTVYIRDCILLQSMTESIWKQADTAAANRIATDQDRVVRLFANIVHNVSLLPADQQRVPVGIYEILLTGSGTLEDRMWIFAEALRQRQIDAFVLQPSAKSEALPNTASASPLEFADVLMGVALDRDVLLFDPTLGTPVPRPADESVVVTQPAGLAELSASERWKDPVIQIVAQPAAFSPRMYVLQQNLPAEHAATLYEELQGGTSEIQPLVERILASGQGAWSKNRIGIWPVPEVKAVAAGALTEEQSAAYTALLRPYDAPFERDPLKSSELLEEIDVVEERLTEEQKMERRMQLLQLRLEKINESSEELFGRASKRLLQTRLEQVMGAADIGMIQQLQQIRIASMQEAVEVELPVGDNKAAVIPFLLPENIRRVHRSATGDALYWTALCQVTRGDFGAAVTTFRNYRRQYPDGRWRFGSLINEAISLLMIGDTETAHRVLTDAVQDDNPELQRAQWMLARFPATTSPTEPQPEAASNAESDPPGRD